MKKKLRKGGTSFLEKIGFENINKKGVYIADDIKYNIRQGKKEELIKKYQDNLNEIKEEVKRAKEKKIRNDNDEKIQNEKNKLTFNERILTTVKG